MTEGRSNKLTLVMMAGLPGSGKTTLALALGKALGWPVMDKDTLKSSLLSIGVHEDVAAPAAYELMFALGRDILFEQRLSVILDSPTTWPITVDMANDLACSAGAYIKFILCLCDRELRNQRMSERAGKLSQPVTSSTTDGDTRHRFSYLPERNTFETRTAKTVQQLVPEVIAYLVKQN